MELRALHVVAGGPGAPITAWGMPLVGNTATPIDLQRDRATASVVAHVDAALTSMHRLTGTTIGDAAHPVQLLTGDIYDGLFHGPAFLGADTLILPTPAALGDAGRGAALAALDVPVVLGHETAHGALNQALRMPLGARHTPTGAAASFRRFDEDAAAEAIADILGATHARTLRVEMGTGELVRDMVTGADEHGARPDYRKLAAARRHPVREALLAGRDPRTAVEHVGWRNFHSYAGTVTPAFAAVVQERGWDDAELVARGTFDRFTAGPDHDLPSLGRAIVHATADLPEGTAAANRAWNLLQAVHVA